MIREKHRDNCIDEIYEIIRTAFIDADPTYLFNTAEAAFDCLHGIARVCPIEATNKMVQSGAAVLDKERYAHSGAVTCWNAMAAVGDLTNSKAPE